MGLDLVLLGLDLVLCSWPGLRVLIVGVCMAIWAPMVTRLTSLMCSVTFAGLQSRCEEAL